MAAVPNLFPTLGSLPTAASLAPTQSEQFSVPTNTQGLARLLHRQGADHGQIEHLALVRLQQKNDPENERAQRD